MRLKGLHVLTSKAKGGVPKHHLISRMILPAVEGCLNKELNWLARLRTARQALSEEGVNLSDPFIAKDLKVATTKGTTIIYSIGGDLTDDGGVRDPKRRYNRGDVVFEVPKNTVPAGEALKTAPDRTEASE